MGPGGGALKKSYIQVSTPEEEISTFLKEAFHCSVCDSGNVQSDSESETHEEEETICHVLYGGLCKQSNKTAAASRLVAVLHHHIIVNHIPIGSLLLMTSGSESVLCFLGICMRRPRLHVLIQATMDAASEEVKFAFANDGCSPRMFTSHQVFDQLISSGQPENVTLELWKYTLQCENYGLQLFASSQEKEWTLDPSMKLNVRKPRAKLPFGLKMPVKKRALTAVKNKSKKQKTKSKVRKKKTSSNSSIPASHDDGGNSDVAPQHTVREETEIPIPISAAAAQEERVGDQLIQAHEALREERQALAEMEMDADVPQAEPASSSRPVMIPTGPAKAKAQPTSFFAASIGLDDVGIAVTARSSCHFCGNKIAKGTIRLSWYHNTRKPSSWLHLGCVAPLILKSDLKSASLERLDMLMAKPRIPEHERNLILAALQKIRASLL